MREPEEAPRETSQILATIFAAQLHIAPEEIEPLMFGLVVTRLTAVPGPRGAASQELGQLRVVDSEGG